MRYSVYSYNAKIFEYDVILRNNVYCLCSIHGLVRGENMELGRDSDTGGQVSCIRVLFCDIEITKALFHITQGQSHAN